MLIRFDYAQARIADWYRSRRRRSKLVDAHIGSLLGARSKLPNRNERMARAKNRSRRSWIGPTIAWGLFVAGCSGVVYAWWRVWTWGRNDWSATQLAARGTFGDSFGMSSALFSGLALVGAFLAAYFQWVALRDERRSAEENAVESRFFQLVGSLQNTVNATRVGRYEGKQAMRKVMEAAVNLGKTERSTLKQGPQVPEQERRADINAWFLEFYHGEYDEAGKEKRYRAGDLLGHQFRLTYHIVKYVSEARAADASAKLFYVRILRAHLSNPELVLLMYNALAEYGYPTMYKLIEDHDLLQNIDLSSLPDADDALLFPSLRDKVAVYKATRGRPLASKVTPTE